ncbi:MAG: tetratricopeptide repeat protein [Bacteroidales bacterium]
MAKASRQKKKITPEMAWERFYKKDFDAALEMFQALIAENPNDAKALYGRACALFRVSDHEGSLADLNALIKADPGNTAALHTRALLYGADEHYDRTLKELKKVAELEPDNGEVWCDMGGTYLLLEDYTNAGVCFERASDIDKSCACSWFGKAVVAMQQKQYKKAIEYLNIVLRLDGKHSLARMARAEMAFSEGKKNEAIKDIRKLLSEDKDFSERFVNFFSGKDGDQAYNDDDENGTISDDDVSGAF